MMDHPRIDEERILDRYLVGRLSAEEEALFEEHLFECADCLEKARWGEELRRGLHEVAAQEAIQEATQAAARATAWVGLLAWLRRRPARPARLARLGGLALLGLALVGALVVLPALVLRQQVELRQLREAAGKPPAANGGLTRPVGDFLVVSLGVVRGASSREVELRPDPTKAAVLLSIELATVDAGHYRVTLSDEADHVLWRGENLEPNLYDTLLIALPSSFLAPGRYRITVEGLTADGSEPAGEVRLRVLPRRGE